MDMDLLPLTCGSKISSLLALLCLFLPWTVLSLGTMTTLGPMWSKSNSTEWDARTPYKNSFILCVLHSGTMTPSCSGTQTPTIVAPSTPMFAMSSGGSFTCGLSYENKKPICWGNLTIPSSFVDVSYIALSAGQDHVCALKTSGEVDCWGGSNYYGQLNRTESSRFIQVSSGYGFTCGLDESGEADCWGWDLYKISPYLARQGGVFFEDLFAGGAHTCGLVKTTGIAVCWGLNNYGQCSVAQQAFSSLALGLFHSCGILRGTGNVVCWGDNAFNQTDAPKNETFSAIAAGDYYTCGVSLKDLGRVMCWGNSVELTESSIKASAGLCSTQACSSRQYQLPEDGSRNCPADGDRVCLNCLDNANCGAKPRKQNHGMAVGISVGVVAAVLTAAAAYLVWRRRKPSKSNSWRSFANRLVSFSSSELATATKNYHPSMIVGRGACGVVYKAVLPYGQTLALKKSQAGDKTLVKELSLLARLHHTHLVNLIGYCAQEQLLAFEFMENGSLFDCLFKKPETRLDCFLRIRIAAQAARGLEYLHNYASPRILHRDVKAANILLDGDWNAHLSDFGFSLATFGNTTQFVTMVGTPGYMDPEYFQTAKFTAKSDVYSFGVVLLELLTGRRAILGSETGLVSWVLKQDRSRLDSLFDPRIFTPENSKALEAALDLALQCTSLNDDHRPVISDAAGRLERVLSTVQRAEEISYGSSSASSGTGFF